MAKNDQIAEKASFVLYLLLFCFILIALRVWQLTVFLHEERVEEAKRPMVRTLYEPGKRGTIRDRFGIPLALNRLSYGVGVVWSEIAEVPAVIWETLPDGSKKRRRLREEYITALSELLSKELAMEARRIEDLIYSKAVFFGNAPFFLKEGLSEESFYRLSALARQWPGIAPERGSKRFYPQGKVGSDILGYMGAIDRPFLDRLFQEISILRDVLEAEFQGDHLPFPEGYTSIDEVYDRLSTLEEKAYTIHDQIGIQGVEKSFEEALRGSRGKKAFEVDAKGHFLKELPYGNPPSGGGKVTLTISEELQAYAEELLAGVEKLRAPLPMHAKRGDKPLVDARGPWIRGGAIIVMEPNSGEVLALASHPRFDPNAFVPRGGLYSETERLYEVRRTLENERYLQDVWMEALPLKRELFDLKKGTWIEEELTLGWEPFLKSLFVRDELSLKALLEIDTIEKAVALRRSKGSESLPSALKDDERLQIVDLVGLLIDEDRFSDEALKHIGKESLSQFKTDQGALYQLKKHIKEDAQDFFHQTYFLPWRELHGKAFLKKKRNEEREENTWARPYLDHFDREEKKQFEAFWNEHQASLIEVVFDTQKQAIFTPTVTSPLKDRLFALPEAARQPYLNALREWEDLKRPLQASWKHLANRKKGEAALALSFHPRYGWGTGRSYAFRQATTQGSVFKLVSAWGALNYTYAALLEKGSKITKELLNPLTIFDEVKRVKGGWTVGRLESGTTIPQLYKGGRIPRSMNYQLGKMDIEKAIATSSNPYFSLLAGEVLPSPSHFLAVAESLSYGQKTGIPLPGEYRGRLPTDLEKNRTGLYATAIGQHTLVVTPLQTAVMLSTLANGGQVLEPKIALESPSIIRREVSLPLPVQEALWKGMRGVIQNLSKEDIQRLFPQEKSFSETFQKVAPTLIGKTSTSDVHEWLGPLSGDPYQVCHVWFGGIAFEGEPFPQKEWKDGVRKPELVVVVHLRFGRLGKEALPIAALIVDKWRQIKAKHSYGS